MIIIKKFMEKDLEKGFYYHYKHDPNGEVNNYAYELIGIAYHSEIEGNENAKMAVYRPLYRTVFDEGRVSGYWNVRPYKMFFENVTKNEKTFPRFSKITDPEVIKRLEKIKEGLYGKE